MPRMWRKVREEGSFTVIEVDVEPGRVTHIPVRTSLLSGPHADSLIEHVLSRYDETRDQLRDFT